MYAEAQGTLATKKNAEWLRTSCFGRLATASSRGPTTQPWRWKGDKTKTFTTAVRHRIESTLRSLHQREEGQSLIEFAVTVPILLVIVTAILAFAVAFNNYIMLTEAVSVGARQLTVSRGQTLDPCNTFSTAVYAAAPLLKQSSIAFTISLAGNSYTGKSCSGSTTSGAPANMILGTNATVTATYPFSLSLYGMKLVPAGSLLTAQTTELMQ